MLIRLARCLGCLLVAGTIYFRVNDKMAAMPWSSIILIVLFEVSMIVLGLTCLFADTETEVAQKRTPVAASKFNVEPMPTIRRYRFIQRHSTISI